MKRPLLFIMLFLVAGIITASICNSYFFCLSVGILLLSLFIAFYQKLSSFKLVILMMVLCYLLGSFEFIFLKNLWVHRYDDFTGNWVQVEGIVSEQPEIKQSVVSYTLSVIEIQTGDKKASGGKIRLMSPKDENGHIFTYGTKLVVQGELLSVKEKRNPGGFDYQANLHLQGISSMMFTKAHNVEVLSYQKDFSLTQIGFDIREAILRVTKKVLPPQQAGLLAGMLIGVRDGMSEEVQAVFSDAGLSHIVAASGANVAFIVLPLLWILRRFLRLGPRVANSITIFFVVLYVYVTGFEPSIVRAAIMATMILVGRILRRDADALTCLSFAAIIMLIKNPFSLLGLGFQLSFAATLSLILFYNGIRRMLERRWLPKGLADVLGATLTAQAGVLPILILSFNKVSVISIITNLLVVPITGVITILGMMMCFIGQWSMGLAQLMGYLNYLLLTFVLWVSKISAALPFATFRVITPPFILVVLYYVFLWLLFKSRPAFMKKLRWIHYTGALMLVMSIFLIYSQLPKPLEITFLDVGQGDCCFIKTAGGKAVLIDGGGKRGDLEGESGVGDQVVVPFLLDQGITKLDLVIATHGHEDHIGGLIAVLENMKVQQLVYPGITSEGELDLLLRLAKKKGVQLSPLLRGATIKLEPKTAFSVLAPFKSEEGQKPSINNTSLVMKLEYMDTTVLFTGDAESEVEEMLLKSGDNLEVDLLKVAHHASTSSSGATFLQKTHAKAAVVCVGRNFFGHPSMSVLERIEKQGMRLYRTDQHGAVMLVSNGKTIRMRTMLK